MCSVPYQLSPTTARFRPAAPCCCLLLPAAASAAAAVFGLLLSAMSVSGVLQMSRFRQSLRLSDPTAARVVAAAASSVAAAVLHIAAAVPLLLNLLLQIAAAL